MLQKKLKNKKKTENILRGYLNLTVDQNTLLQRNATPKNNTEKKKKKNKISMSQDCM